MTRLEKLVSQGPVEWRTLGEVGPIRTCGRVFRTETSPTGEVPFYKIGTMGRKADAYIDRELYEEYRQKYPHPRRGEVLLSVAGTIGRVLVYDGEPAYFQDSNIVWISNDESQVLNRFLYYYYQAAQWKVDDCSSIIARLYHNRLAVYPVPIPPKAVQREIVRILDAFSASEKELEGLLAAELEARRKQYRYYQDRLLRFGEEEEWLRLGDVAEIGTGSSNRRDEVADGAYPLYVRSANVLRAASWEFDEAAVIVPGEGLIGEIYHYVEGKYALHQRAYRIHVLDGRVHPKFLYHFMRAHFKAYIYTRQLIGTVASIRKPMLEAFPIPIPPLARQREIADVLDRFYALSHGLSEGLPAELEARRKQYAYYRERLMSFPRPERGAQG